MKQSELQSRYIHKDVHLNSIHKKFLWNINDEQLENHKMLILHKHTKDIYLYSQYNSSYIKICVCIYLNIVVPGQGRFHMLLEQCALGPESWNCWAHKPWMKPVRLESVLCNRRGHGNEKPIPHNQSSHHSWQLEKPRQQQRPSTANNEMK